MSPYAQKECRALATEAFKYDSINTDKTIENYGWNSDYINHAFCFVPYNIRV